MNLRSLVFSPCLHMVINSVYSLYFLSPLNILSYNLAGTDDVLDIDMNKLNFSLKLLPTKFSICTRIIVDVGLGYTAKGEKWCLLGEYFTTQSMGQFPTALTHSL